eukprot:1158605-Pelagomonas_calceolata.AAC.12
MQPTATAQKLWPCSRGQPFCAHRLHLIWSNVCAAGLSCETSRFGANACSHHLSILAVDPAEGRGHGQGTGREHDAHA